MPTPNLPQAALEKACVNLMLASPSAGGLGYGEMFCKRMFDGQPPSLCGQWFASVWSPGSVRAGPSVSTSLDQYRPLMVTITVRFTKPFDQWLTHRDFLEQKANDVVALIHRDSLNRVITNAANILANYRPSNAPDGVRAIGFVEGLQWEDTGAIVDQGPQWFHAKADDVTAVGISQDIRFGKSRRIQNKANME